MRPLTTSRPSARKSPARAGGPPCSPRNGPRARPAQRGEGAWAGGAYAPEWTSTTASLQLLRSFGVDPAEESVRRALDRGRAHVKWEYADQPYFDGEVEPCINGQAVAIGAYFGQDVKVIVDRLM